MQEKVDKISTEEMMFSLGRKYSSMSNAEKKKFRAELIAKYGGTEGTWYQRLAAWARREIFQCNPFVLKQAYEYYEQ